MSFNQYPIVFEPIFKERIWGGVKLNTVLGKEIHSDKVGESWEASGVTDNVSIVANGVYKGVNLEELIDQYPNEILGAYIFNRFGKQFPLLFKFLDAKEDLSIQLHPDDALAKRRHNSLGKTEMWYVMQADPGARVVVDFKKGVQQEDYMKHLEEKTLPSILNEIPVKKGDVFFIETGTIHAIGGGILLVEIQQTSDITYRVYDWDRLDDQGNSRELHVDLAKDAINYGPKQVELTYEQSLNKANAIVDCPFFSVNYVPLESEYHKQKVTDRFFFYVCTEGSCVFEIADKQYSFAQGDSILIPAAISDFVITGKATLLEIFVS
ncbi:type I phosphomannose isomerase catalytic subunit [Myroides pelagicus]|uniref:Phosphohexomutase n=1 Tax=Myroides pelagicus TaxID=270914 RepID=A0A7K1GL94_9FLAO|nr:type I phosphomannose isomerase catalytic subunit [Myroides pelagicus]MEC4113962.1 type I phosphomannose isomerase catalytic subunit [Myroides pelagicus]MTH29621.1 mannose-6-phosphate isomerase [Myroides pelagicus]